MLACLLACLVRIGDCSYKMVYSYITMYVEWLIVKGGMDVLRLSDLFLHDTM